MNSETSFEQKINDGMVLGQKLVQHGLELMRQVGKVTHTTEIERTRKNVARGFLMTTSRLTGQIIRAVSQDSLGLGMIGMKSLLEYEVDSNYIFDHPLHQNDLAWIDGLCRDVFERTNDLKASKHELGNVPIKKRFTEIGRPDLYKKNYAGLCDYAHLVLRQNMLNDQERFQKLSVDVISQAVCNLIGAIDGIAKFYSLSVSEELKNEVIAYRDKYETVEKV